MLLQLASTQLHAECCTGHGPGQACRSATRVREFTLAPCSQVLDLLDDACEGLLDSILAAPES